ncbi:MAG TPA: thioredoxin [Nostoc sp.]|uniref:thioredoxin n=1 Tax=Nostoc sp. TaxID=1180 RepID=UPI002D3A0D86|nr:thioredoxin [Nostoc sp.]HYX13512.1 thioredoxin [Nostoc sp.]
MSTDTHIVAYVQESEFDAVLTGSEEKVVVVDFTATWCGPCRLVSPLMEQLAEEYKGRAKVVKVDVDSNKPIFKRFGLRSIPAVLIFKDGDLAETIVGVSPYEQFSGAVQKLLEVVSTTDS